ncbi:MAG: nucleotidyl transferase AbiEii/AbiGii toxin family protein [Solirubrobacteraceae bacterium]
MSPSQYSDPRAFRLAVTDRLRPLARDRGVELTDLLRQFAYDRLLCRVFTSDPERWVLKGATAMLARLEGVARHTRDVDLLSRVGGLSEAEQALRAAADLDLDDYFSFTLSPGRQIVQGAGAMRVDVVAFLGIREFAKFHVDLVVDRSMTRIPNAVSQLVAIDLPGLPSTTYRAYPVADHVADKVCALLELHERASGLKEGSTRFRDLADLVVFAHTATVDATALTTGLSSEAERRGLALPSRIAAPTGRDWPRGYVGVARDVPHMRERDLSTALETVGLFIDPVLTGTARGSWDPATLRWRDGDVAPRS